MRRATTLLPLLLLSLLVGPAAAAPADLAALPAAHPWRAYAVARAKSSSDYNDNGQYAAICYRMTGDPAYARQAGGQLLPFLADPVRGVAVQGSNAVRQFGWECAYWYSLVRDHLDADTRTRYEDALRLMADRCVREPVRNFPKYVGGFLLSDSDQCVGQYLALLWVDRVLGTNYLDGDARGATGDVICPVGGRRYDPAKGPRGTVRNWLYTLCAVHAKGGEWVESAEYNWGTLSILFAGLLADDRALADFPEVKQLAAEVASWCPVMVTADLKWPVLWGDAESPDLPLRSRAHLKHLPLLPLVYALTGDDRPLALFKALSAGSFNLWDTEAYKAFLAVDGLFHPDKPAGPWSPRPGLYVAAGTGHVRHLAADGTLLCFHAPTRIGVHHEWNRLPYWWCYAGGEWVDGLRGYAAAVASDPLSGNGAAVYGLGAMLDRGLRDVAPTATGFRAVGYSKGPYYQAPYYRMPTFSPEYGVAVEWDSARRLLTLDHSLTGAPPDPLQNWQASDKGRLAGAFAPLAVAVHARAAAPQADGDAVSWTTPGGQPVRAAAAGATARQFGPEPAAYGTAAYPPAEVAGKSRLVWGSADRLSLAVTLGTPPTPPPPPPPPPPAPRPVVRVVGPVLVTLPDGTIGELRIDPPVLPAAGDSPPPPG